MIRRLARYLPQQVTAAIENSLVLAPYVWARKSYSQEAEDLLLWTWFAEHQPTKVRTEAGRYVEIGALHPARFSNSFLFYQRGWRGVTVEPNPEVKPLFRRTRQRDTHLACGVGGKQGNIEYYCFSEPAYNTFDTRRLEQLEQQGVTPIHRSRVDVFPLAKLLKEHWPVGVQIDFMSIDAEGSDLSILSSNDWERYRPTLVLCETEPAQQDLANDRVCAYLTAQAYRLIARTFRSALFLDGSWA